MKNENTLIYKPFSISAKKRMRDAEILWHSLDNRNRFNDAWQKGQILASVRNEINADRQSDNISADMVRWAKERLGVKDRRRIKEFIQLFETFFDYGPGQKKADLAEKIVVHAAIKIVNKKPAAIRAAYRTIEKKTLNLGVADEIIRKHDPEPKKAPEKRPKETTGGEGSESGNKKNDQGEREPGETLGKNTEESPPENQQGESGTGLILGNDDQPKFDRKAVAKEFRAIFKKGIQLDIWEYIRAANYQEYQVCKDILAEHEQVDSNSDKVEMVINFWLEWHQKKGKRFTITKGKKDKIRARLQDYEPIYLVEAFLGASKTAWTLKHGHLTIDHVYKNETNMDKYQKIFENDDQFLGKDERQIEREIVMGRIRNEISQGDFSRWNQSLLNGSTNGQPKPRRLGSK